MTLRRGAGEARAYGGRGSRLDRVAEQLRQELSSLMLTEMKDERVRFATVSKVAMTPDLRSARVMVSVTGSDPERHAVVAALRHAEGYLRGQLGQRLENLKTAPHLTFELDESIAYSIRIGSMLSELRPESGWDGGDRGEGGEPGPRPTGATRHTGPTGQVGQVGQAGQVGEDAQ